jgi:hypothetical protein
MDSELIIFNVEEEAPESKTERDVELDEVKKRLPRLARHFETIYAMEDYLQVDEPPDSGILQILSSYVMNYFVPILEEGDFSIAIREISKPTRAFDNSIGSYRIVVPGDKLSVIGFKIDPRNPSLTYDFQDLVKTEQLLLSGFYQERSNTTRRFLRQRKEFASPGLPSIARNGEVIFRSEDDARSKLKKIIEYIQFMLNFYSSTSTLELERDISDPVEKKKKPIEKFSDTDDVAKAIEKLAKVDLGPTQYIARERLRSLGLLKAKELGDLLGVADAEFLAELKKFTNSKKEKTTIKERQRKNFAELYRNAGLDFIARRKYGINFDDLGKRRKKEVILEFKARPPGTFEEITAVNKKLLELWQSIRESFLDNEKSALIKLIRNAERELEAEGIGKDKIGLLVPGVCSHVLDRAKLMAKNFDHREMHNIVRDALVDKYSLPETADGFVCKFCGELIARPDSFGEVRFFGGQKISYKIIEDPLRTQIWKEANYIVSAYIRFERLTSSKQFVSALADGLRSVIGKREALLLRSKTAKIETVRDTLSLYIVIYVYASLCAMMISSPGVMKFGRDPPDDRKKKKTGGRSVFTGGILATGGKTFDPTEERRLLAIALNLIVMTKEPLIHQLKNINIDIVKHIFLREAYPWARNSIAGVKHEQEQKTDNAILVERRLRNSPLWHFTLQMNPHTSDREILGASIQALAQADNIFEKVKPPEYPSKSLPKSPLNDYKFLAYQASLAYEQRQIAQKFHDPPSAEVLAFREEFSKPLEELQEPLEDDLLISKLFPAKPLPFNQDLRNKLNRYAPDELDLANFYCPDGKRHKIGSFVFETKKDIAKQLKLLEIEFTSDSGNYVISKSEVKKFTVARKKPEDEKLRRRTWASMKIIDEVCSLCQVRIRLAKSGKTSDETLAPLFRRINEIEAFFEYYSGRCPKKGLHTFVDKGKDKICEKCGKIEGVVDERSAFYKKYIGEFRKVEKVKLDSIREMMREKERPREESRKVSYEFTLSATSEWSKHSKKKYNVLVNLGLLTKDIDYEDIESAKVDPSGVEDTTYGVAAFIRRGFLLEVMREYNLLLNLDIRELTKGMKEIVKRTQALDLNNLRKVFPKPDFIGEERRGFDLLDTKKYANFLLEYLAGFIVQLYLIKGDYASLARELANYFTQSIVKKDKYYSKAKNVVVKSWGERENEDDSGNEQNYLSADDLSRSDEGESEEFDAERNDIGDFDDAFDVENADDIWERD